MARKAHIRGHRYIWIYSSVVVIIIAFGFLLLRNSGVWAAADAGTDTAQPIDSLNGVFVYYNGPIHHVGGRHVSAHGYNYGLKWQCVEFVKRYYADHLGHEMPDTWGNARDFFNTALPDASYNTARALVQYSNPSLKQPRVDDIIVFEGTLTNKYGHIAIISAVTDTYIEIIQQNAGADAPTREQIVLEKKGDRWQVKNKRVLGWMRIE